ncbi:phosphoribosylanthranilate isomerase [Thermodesulfitimonas autotrophica]|nr:phosphoribosylanthranilate isomerase [Thermodesulfitimonas autotrophica]
MMVRVKICGIQDVETARVAVAAGADALGFVFAASRRQVTPETVRQIVAVLPPFVVPVGVFVDAPLEAVKEIAAYCGLGAVQLHGAEPPGYCQALREIGFRVIKGFRVKGPEDLAGLAGYRVDALLLDTFVPGVAGGTGKAFDWGLLAGKVFPVPLVLAGGLTPENVAEAVRRVRPYAVDVSSGVETGGRKDPARIRLFIQRAKEVF